VQLNSGSPRTHTKFWRDKIETNKRRDHRVSQRLRRAGWTVIRVKECAVFRPGILRRISRAIESRRGRSSEA
jgi:G:T-mismatch repair DNA endonuclease (very short patch repair protein)